MFEVGQKIRRVVPVKSYAYDCGMRQGDVYTVCATAPYLVLEEFPTDVWSEDKFIPFKWTEGDTFKIVAKGFGLGFSSVGKTGKLVKKKETVHSKKGDGECWETNLPIAHHQHVFYYVGEPQIEFVQPSSIMANGLTEAETIVSMSVSGLSTKPQRRYLNKGQTHVGGL